MYEIINDIETDFGYGIIIEIKKILGNIINDQMPTPTKQDTNKIDRYWK